ncbi:MAG: methionine--tRNA ligase subunit beta [Candidatus Omnitrophica bacterium]|nr:methionine--tRNA ligase subunit beta [Candidatus Omnitrophota bacterium]
MVTFDEFKKLDIRVAKVLEVEDHPNADKLYVLRIDTGTDTRTIVAGIRNFYKKEELLGRNIVVITNLEPATIRGVQSNGMLLAASDKNGICILTPDKNPLPGSKIS